MGDIPLQPTATKILELLFDLNLEENPILFHVFSNGGGVLYKSIIDVLHSEPQFGKLCVAGTIFDSAPGRTDPTSGAKALIAAQPNMNIFFRYFLGLAFLLNCTAMWFVRKSCIVVWSNHQSTTFWLLELDEERPVPLATDVSIF